MKKSIFLLIVTALFFSNCQPKLVGETYDPPGSTDTKDKAIAFQAKTTYHEDYTYVTNNFKGGRLNGFEKLENGKYLAMIRPENAPINNSPWYSFKVWSAVPQTIEITLSYEDGNHRYYPKLSTDGETWTRLDTNNFKTIDTANVTLTLETGTDTLWVSAQELKTTKETGAWMEKLGANAYVYNDVIGESKLGRPIPMMTITDNETATNFMIVTGRQHPPEVTGHIAMEAFVETVAGDTKLAKDFRQEFQLIVFPLVNPDGVDNGHWRHNAGGIDLNRDWVNFNQPEIKHITRFLKKRIKNTDGKVWFGFDFHSTQEDVLYTIINDVVPRDGSIVKPWLENIKTQMPEDEWVEDPFGITSPIAKNWMFRTFGCEAITYEVGDEMDRPYLRKKAQVSAEEMMKILLERTK